MRKTGFILPDLYTILLFLPKTERNAAQEYQGEKKRKRCRKARPEKTEG